MKMYRPHRLCPRNSKPKEPSLYRSLCVSILCMFLSTVMLVGTTMAWFSDSLQTGVYTISSANFTVTTFFCTDLADGSGTNNWQRLNPGNTTMFGGGSLSSGSCQTAYLKIVNNSTIDLNYTLTITNTNGDTAGGTGPTLPLSLAYKKVDNEADLKTAFTSTDESSTQSGENTSTGTEISFIVPKATTVDGAANPTIKFVALKLSLNDTPTGGEQPATQYKFGLRLAITQTDPTAQAAEPEPPVITDVNMDIIGSTPSTLDPTASDPANSSGEVTQQPADGNNSGTNTPETPSGSPTETKNPTETPESGNAGTTGTTGTTSGGDTTVTENGSET